MKEGGVRTLQCSYAHFDSVLFKNPVFSFFRSLFVLKKSSEKRQNSEYEQVRTPKQLTNLTDLVEQIFTFISNKNFFSTTIIIIV